MAAASGRGYSPSDHAFAIAQARSQVPSQTTGNGYHIKTASIINDQLEVVIGDPAGHGIYHAPWRYSDRSGKQMDMDLPPLFFVKAKAR
jgi:hypothetical protein